MTCGALSLMGNPFWREGFGPMLPGAEHIPFENAQSLEAKLSTRQFAAFIVEPVQAEGGIRIPHRDYLQTAQQLCRKYETLFVLDEVQSGMFRTGGFLAAHHYDLDPDIVVLAKALSGGLIPIGAVLMSDRVYKSVYNSLKRAIVHTSTYSENGLAMRAGLATLEVLETEYLGRRAIEMGGELRRRLRETLSGYEMIKDIRGLGTAIGHRIPGAFENQPPSTLRGIPTNTSRAVRPNGGHADV